MNKYERKYQRIRTITWLVAGIFLILIAVLIMIVAVPADASTPVPVTHPLFSAKQRYAHTGHYPNGHYYNIYTENDGRHWTRLQLTRIGNVYQPSFTVNSLDVHGWNFPNIGQGANHGMVPGHGVRKTWLPVRANYDGNPYATVSDHLIWRGNWQAGFDVWFEPRYDTNGQYQQYGGTEIMVITAVSRHGEFSSNALPGYSRGNVYVDSRWWHVTASVTSQGAKTWHRIYFTALKPMSTFSGPLNGFFRAAEHYKMLSSGWWLTGIENGFEINTGGIGMAVNSYDLHGVSSSPSLNTDYSLPHVLPKVPKVTGMHQAVAVQRLRKAGYRVRQLTKYVKGRTLIVVAQSIRPGTPYAKGRTVKIRSRIRR